MANLSVDQLAKAVNDIMAEYAGLVTETLEEAVDITAKETVKELKATSPKASGAYAKAWAQKKVPQSGSSSYGRVAYVKAPHYRLTHLLEYGHAKVNGGRVAARPHIAEAEQKAIANFEARLREGLNNDT